jgi:SAM-dependent methyltransferase
MFDVITLMTPISRVILPAMLAAGFWAGSALAAEPPSPDVSTNRYEFRARHNPDGIGKFYMGREIAFVMGHQAADWLERPEREEEEHSQQLLKELKIKPGDAVADIGAGTGYFSRRIARLVGPTGKVFANDIQPEMLELLTNKMAADGISNVVAVLGSVTNAGLPASSVDLALMVDVYHEFDYPFEMMQSICRSLKPGGRVVFVEFRGEDPQVPIKPVHKMTEAQVKKEMAAQPLEWVETISVLPRQHIIIFRRRPDRGPVSLPPKARREERASYFFFSAGAADGGIADAADAAGLMPYLARMGT